MAAVGVCDPGSINVKRNINWIIVERKLVMENNAPVKEFRAGQIKASLWINSKDNGKGDTVQYYSVKIVKSYKPKNEDEWKTSNSYFREDLPKVQLVAAKAFEYISLTESKEGDIPA